MKDNVKRIVRRTLLFRSIETYYKFIKPGMRLYKKYIGRKKNRQILVHAWPGMGDIFLIHKYLDQYLEKKNIHDYVIVVSGQAAYQVVSLFEPQEKIIKLSQMQKDSLIKLKQFMGKRICNLEILHHDPPSSHTSIGCNIQGYKKTTTKDMLLKVALGINGDDDAVKMPTFKYEASMAEKYLLNNKLVPGKTVIISPYANSCANAFPIEVYSLIANSLNRLGYTVATNVTGKEKAIPGTKELRFDIDASKAFLEKAGYFISMRSGLCDVVGHFACKKIVLYNANSHCGRNKENNYFALDKIGLGSGSIKEINVNQMKAQEAITEILYEFAIEADDCAEKTEIIDRYLDLQEKNKETYDFKPAFKENNIAVAFSCSNEYVPYLCVAIISLIANSSSYYNYDIIVLEDDITKDNKKIIESYSCNNIKIRFIDISNIISQYDLYTWGWYRPIMYGRFLLPDLLYHYDKILYLDSDLVVLSDVSELYNTEFSNDELIAAVIDVGIVNAYCMSKSNEKKYFDRVLQLKNPKKYINSGVILFNNAEVRKTYSSDKLLEYVQSRNWKWQDQDVFMKLFEGKILYLNQEWNVMIQALDGGYEKMGHDADYDLQKAYERALDNPKIVHYIENKMMIMNPITPHFDKFWKYARQSYYYEVLLSRRRYL